MDESLKKALLNDVESHCHVPSKTWDEVIKAKIPQPNSLRRRNIIAKRVGYTTAAAVFTGAAVLASGFVSSAMAGVLKSVPVIGIMYQFNDPVVQSFATTSNSSAVDQGITVSIPSAYYDNHEIQFVYNIKVPSNFNASKFSQIAFDPSTWTLNGQSLRASGMSGDKLVGDHIYHGDAEFQITSGPTLDSGTLVIPIEQVGSVKGEWVVSVPISSHQVVASEHSSQPMMSKSYDGLTLTVKHVEVGPVNTVIDYELTQSVDSNGNTEYTMKAPWFTFPAFDSDHKIMWQTGSDLPSNIHTEGNTKVWDFSVQYKSPASDKSGEIYLEPNYNPETGRWSHAISQLEMKISVQ